MGKPSESKRLGAAPLPRAFCWEAIAHGGTIRDYFQGFLTLTKTPADGSHGRCAASLGIAALP